MNDKCIVYSTGKKTYLRPPVKEDVENFTRWMNNPEVTQFLNQPFPILMRAEEEYIEGLAKKENRVSLVIMTIEERVPIGNLGLDVDFVNRVGTSGVAIGEKDYWGKGYGTDAKMQLLDIAFNRLNLRKVVSTAIGNNPRSIAYQKKCGGRIIGRSKDHIFRNGRYYDEVLFEVFKEDWEPLYKTYMGTE